MTKVLIDTGAYTSCLSLQQAKLLGIQVTDILRTEDYGIAANGQRVKFIGTAEISVRLGGLVIYHDFYIVNDLNHKAIMGHDLLTKLQAVINLDDKSISFLDGLVVMKLLHPGADEFVLRSLDTVIIKPYTEAWIKSSVPEKYVRKHNEPVSYVRPLHNRKPTSLLTAHSVASITNNVTVVQLLNASPFVKRIKKNMPIAAIGNAEIVQPVNTQIAPNSQTYVISNDEQFALEKERHKIAEPTLQNKIDELKHLGLDLNFPNLDSERKATFIDLLYEFRSNFAQDGTDLPGSNLVECEIHLSDKRPFRVRPYRLTPPARKVMDKVCDQMEKAGIIKPSDSPFSSPCLLVMKNKMGNKDDPNNYRLVTDSRHLNEVTLPIFMPLVTIDEVFEIVGNKSGTYFSKCDLKSSFHQLKIKDEHQKYTAFTTGSGRHMQYTRAPMGMLNSSHFLMLALHKLFGADINKRLIAYVDDILMVNSTFEGHCEDIRFMMEKLRQGNLKLHPQKCIFMKAEIDFLGFHLNSEGSRPSETKVKVVKDYKTIKNAKDVRSFLGLTQYFRRYIQNYSQITFPLRELTKTDCEFKWSEKADESFLKLKEILTNPPLLVWPRADDKFVVVVDGCKTGVGYLLAVEREGKLKPVQYGGKALTKSQQNYDITNIEAYALVCAVREFRMWLINTQFTVYTDHYSLQWLKKKKGSSGRLLRWSIELSEYNYHVTFKAGKSNTAADFLSRIDYDGLQGKDEIDEDEEKIIFSMTEANQVKPQRRKPKRSQITIEWESTTADSQQLQQSSSCKQVQPAAVATATAENIIPTLRDATASMERRCSINAVSADSPELGAEITFQQYDLKKLQRECSDFAEIIHYKETGRLPENKDRAKQIIVQADNFYLHHTNVLYHVQCVRTKRLHEYLPLVSQVCVPKCLREIVLKQVHDRACHAGFEKAWTSARQRFWWKSLAEDIHLYIRSCEICARCKPEYNKKKVPQTNIAVAGFMEAWSFDHVGPLTETEGPIKYKYILTATEQLSLYTEMFPVITCSAVETAEKLYELVCRWGLFSKAQFDRGSAYVSKIMTELMKLLSVKTLFSSSSHPKTNGKLERFHSTLGVALRAYADGNKTNWHKLLPTIAHGFNTTAVTPTGFCPYTVVTGTKPRTLADCLIQPETDLPTDVHDYVTEITKRVSIIREIAKKNMQGTHELAKQKHDKQGTATPTHEPGDIVYLHREQFKKHECAKLADKFEGPMLILHCGPNYTYKLRNMITGKDSKYMVNACRLRPYTDGKDSIYNRNGTQYDPNRPTGQVAAGSATQNVATPPVINKATATTAPSAQTAAAAQTSTNKHMIDTQLSLQQQKQLGITANDTGGRWFTVKRVIKDRKAGNTRQYLVVWQEDNTQSWVSEKDMAPKSLRDYLVLKDERKRRRRQKRRQ